MANKEHVGILKKGVDAWNKWRRENPTIQPNLSGADLSEANLRGADLRRANLRGAQLSWIDNHRETFSEADLSEADLRGANLRGAQLSWMGFDREMFSEVDFSGADLCEANLRGAQLRRANFSNACLETSDFSNADLRGANLSGADFTGANLNSADLRDANLNNGTLSGVDLSWADLRGMKFGEGHGNWANFRGAKLDEANLRGASLHGSNLSDTQLCKTILIKAHIGATIFANTDLSLAIGLETIFHHSPSSIGIDTIYKSKGNIPEVFLRGAGLDDVFIEHIKSFTAKPFEFFSCFISYSHKDQSFARWLHDKLQERNIRCWLDEHQLLPGDDIYEQVDRGIKYWDKILLCCSEHSLTSWWVDNEISSAFKKEQELMRARKEKVLALIPLNLDGYMFSNEWKNGKKGQVKERLAADFTGWESDNTRLEDQLEFERVVKALQTKGEREEIPVSKL